MTTALPADYHTISPYLVIKGAAKAIDFYKKVFYASELMRMNMPDGKIGFAELKIGDSLLLLSDEFTEMAAFGPHTLGGSPVRIHLYVDDVDAIIKKAVSAGAKLLRPAQDQFFGDRSASIEDPFGHIWSIATHKEDVSRSEMLKRFNQMMKQQ